MIPQLCRSHQLLSGLGQNPRENFIPVSYVLDSFILFYLGFFVNSFSNALMALTVHNNRV